MLSEGRFGVSRTRRVRKHPRALFLTRRQSVSSPCAARVRVHFQSVCRAICRRPSWHVWACPSLTETRLSPVRQKSVGKPVCRPCAVRRESVPRPWQVRRPSRNVAKCRHQTNARPSAARQKSVASPSLARGESAAHERHTNQHKTNATQDATERRTNAERTTDEHTPARSTGVPRKHEDRRASVTSPLPVRNLSVRCT